MGVRGGGPGHANNQVSQDGTRSPVVVPSTPLPWRPRPQQPPSTLTGPGREGRAPHPSPPRPHVRTLPALPAGLANDRRRKGTAHWTLARSSSLLASQRHSKALLRQILGHGWPSAPSPENHGSSPERPKETRVPPTTAGGGGAGAPAA